MDSRHFPAPTIGSVAAPAAPGRRRCAALGRMTGVLTAAATLSILLAGCATSGGAADSRGAQGDHRGGSSSAYGPSAGTVQVGDRADRAAAAYRAGRYGETIAITDEMRRAGDQPQVARYLGGLAAYRLNRMSEAEHHFAIAMEGSDMWIVDRAEAMLGMIALETDRPQRAAELLGRAASRLDGPDASDAARYASRAARLLGDGDRAARWDQLAGNVDHGASVTGATVGRYVLQIGAFEDFSAARTAAAAHQDAVSRAGLGAIRVETISDARGRTLYAPRIGRFATANEAERIRLQEGWLGFIVRSVSH